MAQFRKDTQQFLADSKSIFEVSLLGTADGSVASNSNALGVMTNNQNSLAAPWEVQVARGKVPGVSLVNLYGYQAAVDGAFIPIWEANTAYTYPSNNGEIMTLYSTSASDTNVSVQINGLDSSFNIQSETLVLTNGTTGVNTTKSYRRINSILVVGSVNPVGTLYLSNTGKTTNYAIIALGTGRSQMSIYTVPNGYTLYLNRVTVAAEGSTNGKALNYRSYTINGNGIIGTVLTSPFAANYETNRVVPNPYPGNTSIQWQCQSPTQLSAMGLRVEGVLIAANAA